MRDSMTAEEQAELQGKLWGLLEGFRAVKGLSDGAIFGFGMSFLWGYARRANASHEDICARAREFFDGCDRAYQARVRESVRLLRDKGHP